MPEQKAGPSPRITTTRTSGFLSSASICSTSPLSMARFIALRRSGRFMVSVAIPPSMCKRSSSVMRRPLIDWSRGGARAAPPPDPPTHFVSSQQVPRDDHAMHFAGALADAAHAGRAVPALQRELLADAVAPVDLDGGIDDAAQHLARVELGDGGLHPRVLAAVGLPGAGPDEPAAGADLHLGVRQHPLDG